MRTYKEVAKPGHVGGCGALRSTSIIHHAIGIRAATGTTLRRPSNFYCNSVLSKRFIQKNVLEIAGPQIRRAMCSYISICRVVFPGCSRLAYEDWPNLLFALPSSHSDLAIEM